MLQMRLSFVTLTLMTLTLMTLTLRLDVVVMAAAVDGKVFTDVLDNVAKDSLGLQEIQVGARIPTLELTHTHMTLQYSHKNLILLENVTQLNSVECTEFKELLFFISFSFSKLLRLDCMYWVNFFSG